MVVRIRNFPRGVLAVVVAMVAASCAGRSVSESDGNGTGGDSGSGGAVSGGTGGAGGTGGSVPGSGGTGGSPGSGGVVAQGGGTPAGGTGGKGVSVGGVGSTGGTGIGGSGGDGGTVPMTGGSGGTVPMAGAGGAPAREACLQPIVGGECSAFFLRWGFNSATGQCEEFVYGGCGQNENNFETEAACVATCEPLSEATACMGPGDCALVDPVCCRCNPGLSDLLAVNRQYVNDILAPCELVDCDGCTAPAFSSWFTSLCEEGHCKAVDAREHELTECTVDTDCRLRMGLGCCDCGSQVVAVNVNVSVEALVCPEGGCMADCAPQYPPDAVAACFAGRCGVEAPTDN